MSSCLPQILNEQPLFPRSGLTAKHTDCRECLCSGMTHFSRENSEISKQVNIQYFIILTINTDCKGHRQTALAVIKTSEIIYSKSMIMHYTVCYSLVFRQRLKFNNKATFQILKVKCICLRVFKNRQN